MEDKRQVVYVLAGETGITRRLGREMQDDGLLVVHYPPIETQEGWFYPRPVESLLIPEKVDMKMTRKFAHALALVASATFSNDPASLMVGLGEPTGFNNPRTNKMRKRGFGHRSGCSTGDARLDERLLQAAQRKRARKAVLLERALSGR